jgi:Sec-independent protein secretion pathway component TatC
MVPRLWEFLRILKGVFKLINCILYLPSIFFVRVLVQRLPVDWFLESRRITILICVFLGAIITPPDVFSQRIVATLLIGLLEIMRLALFFRKRYRMV